MQIKYAPRLRIFFIFPFHFTKIGVKSKYIRNISIFLVLFSLFYRIELVIIVLEIINK